MSVACLSAQEFGTFAALCVKLHDMSLAEACTIAEIAAEGNRLAYEHQYREFVEPITADDIEREALRVLADEELQVTQHFGPVAYNMVANDGTCYGSLSPVETVEHIGELEKSCRAWQDAAQRKRERAEEDAEAYDAVGKLHTLPPADIKARCAAAGCQRVIYAEFRVNESDSHSDYHGCRSVRRVVIGYGKGKRESFAQLRKAAGKFPPTAKYGPGKDIYRPRVVLTSNVTGNGCAYWKGTRSSWHNELDGGHNGVEFDTREAAEAHTAEKGEPEDIHFGESVGTFGWEITQESYENRENYSMGGGNYLGRSRYSGWVVRSTDVEYWRDDCEVFTPAKKRFEQKQAPPASANGYAVEKHHHTKRGVDFWLCVPSERMDRDTFEAERGRCKAAGGWYSRKWGTTPGGFAFETEADAMGFAGEAPAAETAEPTPPRGNSERLRKQAASMAKKAEQKLAPRETNTPKRLAQARHSEMDGQRYKRASVWAMALADAIDAGTVPEVLIGFRPSIDEWYGIAAQETKPVSNGYHGYSVETGIYRSNSPEAVAVRGLADHQDDSAEIAIRRAEDALRFRDIPGFFPTPASVIGIMIDAAGELEGKAVLEPSAGKGDIADAARDAGASVECVEINGELCELLKAKGHTVTQADFLAGEFGRVDAVLMNPPFERGQDADHVRHAFQCLKPGGRLVAIMSEGTFSRSDSRSVAFREWLDQLGGITETIDSGAFSGAGAFRKTGVAVRLVVIDRPEKQRLRIVGDCVSV